MLSFIEYSFECRILINTLPAVALFLFLIILSQSDEVCKMPQNNLFLPPYARPIPPFSALPQFYSFSFFPPFTPVFLSLFPSFSLPLYVCLRGWARPTLRYFCRPFSSSDLCSLVWPCTQGTPALPQASCTLLMWNSTYILWIWCFSSSPRSHLFFLVGAWFMLTCDVILIILYLSVTSRW